MCIRYALSASRQELIREFGVQACPETFPAGYNLGPSQLLPVICLGEDGKRVVRLQWWGLSPPGAGNGKRHATLANARAESLAKKPSLHEAYRERRCIVPASGFFEWAEEGLEHRPNYVQPVAGSLMGLAAIWEYGPEGAEGPGTFVILTVQANERLMAIHHRMPIILEPGDYGAWLDPQTPRQEVARLAHRCLPADRLLAYPVSPAVNEADNNSPDVIKPLRSAVF